MEPEHPSDANVLGELPPRFAGVQRLGDGSEGGTFVAHDEGSGARVVLKRVEATRIAAVRHAVGVLRTVGSPHLPSVRELVTTPGGAAWLATDWVAGEPLPAGPVPVEAAVAQGLALAHALAAIHSAGTHHGDVSPANVVVTPTRGVVLVDLGQLGRMGTGTPGFLAPEVLAGGGGPAADRFALGCLLCWRLFGEVPWQRPETLLAVRGPKAVRQRLDALAGTANVPTALARLLARLLDPRPEVRPDADVLVERLARIRAAANAGVDLRPAATWWPPARWPYRGVDVGALADRAHDGRVRLVAVAGPSGCGRGRVVEELVLELQSRGHAAQLADASRLGPALGRPQASWLEAWSEARPPSPLVIGVPTPPVLIRPPVRSDSGGPQPAAVSDRAHAAVLRAAADAATTTLVLPVSEGVGRALQHAAASAIEVAWIRPWSTADIEASLQGVLDAPQLGRWAEALASVTGGWPSHVVAAMQACASAELERPRVDDIETALAEHGRDGLRLEPALARVVLQARWDPASVDVATLPAHLHDGTAPLGSCVGAARRVLASELPALAAATAEAVRASDRPVSLALALDADAVADVDAALARPEPLAPADPARGTLVQWLLDGGAERVQPKTRACGARLLLADGAAERALALVRRGRADPVCALEEARALQRLGQIEEALAVLEPARSCDDRDLSASAVGLRWRLLVDAGRAADARTEASAASLPRRGVGAATARLWAAFAALVAGDSDDASRWLSAAEACVAEIEGSAAAGVRARVIQLIGNVAHDRGDLLRAARAWSRAADAFAEAGEAVGGLQLRGSLAALAIPMADTAVGIRHGRAAVRGLVVHGQLSALETATLALVQLLGRTGALEEATAAVQMVDDVLSPTEPAPLSRARLARMRADLEAAALVSEATSGAASRDLAGRRRAVETAYVRAARSLERAEAVREALDAWLRAAALARIGGRLAAGRAHLAQAEALGRTVDDESSRLGVALEALAAAGASADRGALERVEETLRRLPGVDALLRSGRLELAWTYDRALLAAARVQLPSAHPGRRAIAARSVQTLEAIMNKTSKLDRSAVRASFTLDGGESGALRDLLGELGDAPVETAPAPAQAPPAEDSARADEASRLERLMRIYRRLAREDRLEPLLEQIVDAVMDLTDAERGAVVVRQGDGAPLEVTRELAGTDGAKFSRSIIDRVLAEGDPVLSVDAAQDDRFDQSRSVSHLNLRSVLAVPLRFRGELLGAFYVDHRLRRGNFDESDLRRTEEFADLAALAVAHARALSEVRAQADTLEKQQHELAALLEAREAEVAGLREEVRATVPDRKSYRGIVGATEAMQRVFRLIDRLAESDVPVVIYGESGTGKELVARAIHDAGSRAEQPFVAENCGAIPETLLESVLFGHAKGAFTGAQKSKAGLFEAADGGTIFLDEVSEMSPAMQTKLLRVLQEGEVRRVGENTPRPVDVRVIAASNRDLDAAMEQGTFRRDLYYRIHVVRLDLPPLRERIDDIPALVQHFLARHGAASSRPVAPAAMRALCAYAWPGNVRELENEVQRWVALCEGTVDVADLSAAVTGSASSGVDPDDLRIRPRVDRLERDLIARALDRTEGNQTRAAELLGLSRYGLQKKLRRLADEGIDL